MDFGSAFALDSDDGIAASIDVLQRVDARRTRRISLFLFIRIGLLISGFIPQTNTSNKPKTIPPGGLGVAFESSAKAPGGCTEALHQAEEPYSDIGLAGLAQAFGRSSSDVTLPYRKRRPELRENAQRFQNS